MHSIVLRLCMYVWMYYLVSTTDNNNNNNKNNNSNINNMVDVLRRAKKYVQVKNICMQKQKKETK